MKAVANCRYKFKFPLLLLSVIVLAPILLFLSFDVGMLRENYIKVDVDENGPKYQFVKTRPKTWQRLEKLPPWVYGAFIANEDWSYYEHSGIDTVQIKKALVDSLTKGKKLRGASTITQQVVKNLFFSHERSFTRKGMEAILAFTLNSLVSKQKILETYLNIIQYGKRLYGIEKASRFYFGKRASQLTPVESSFLAIILPSPISYSQSFYKGEPSPFILEQIDRSLVKMRVLGYISKDRYKIEASRQLIFRKLK